MTRLLPGRCHNALNRLLRTAPWSTRALTSLLVVWVIRSGMPGYLCLDDVVVEKAFARRLRWAGWTYSFAKKRKVYGMHVVVVLWCSSDGGWRIPVAFWTCPGFPDASYLLGSLLLPVMLSLASYSIGLR